MKKSSHSKNALKISEKSPTVESTILKNEEKLSALKISDKSDGRIKE